MSNENFGDSSVPKYGEDSFASESDTRDKFNKRRRPDHSRRRGKTPQSFNGMHRRRRRKAAW